MIDYKRKTSTARFDGSKRKALWIKDFAVVPGSCSQSYPQIVCGTLLEAVASAWREIEQVQFVLCYQTLVVLACLLRTMLSTEGVQKCDAGSAWTSPPLF